MRLAHGASRARRGEALRPMTEGRLTRSRAPSDGARQARGVSMVHPDSHPDTPSHRSLAARERTAPFSVRHIGPGAEELSTTLSHLGFGSRLALIDAAVPGPRRDRRGLRPPAPASEARTEAELRARLHLHKTLCTPHGGEGPASAPWPCMSTWCRIRPHTRSTRTPPKRGRRPECGGLPPDDGRPQQVPAPGPPGRRCTRRPPSRLLLLDDRRLRELNAAQVSGASAGGAPLASAQHPAPCPSLPTGPHRSFRTG